MSPSYRVIYRPDPQTRAEYLSQGLWSDRPLYSLFDDAVAATPEKAALVDGSHRLTYGQAQALTMVLARRFLEAGVEPGDTVLVQLPNSVWLPLVHLAANRVGGVMVPVSESWRRTEVEHLLRLADPRVVILMNEHGDEFDGFSLVAELQSHLSRLSMTVPLQPHPVGVSLEELMAEPGALHPAAVEQLVEHDPDAPSFAMVSSGTVGMPKVSLYTDNGLQAFLLGGYRSTVQYTANDISLGIAPASTGAVGYVYPALTPLLVGATSCLLDHWSPAEALDAVQRERPTVMVAVPTQIIKMIEHPHWGSTDFGALTRFSNGGAPMPEGVARRVETDAACLVHSMYGATDACTATMTNVVDPPEKRLATVGLPLPGQQVRIVTPQGVDAEAGEPGEVVWRGAQKTLGYLRDPERDEEAFDSDGWYYSGDLGRFDADGYLQIIGRIKDMIIRGGQNIFPREVEELLIQHPKVADVAVVGVADPVMGERACACVIPRDSDDPPSLDELVTFLTSFEIARFKQPERLEIMSDFPHSAGEKVQKDVLAKLIQP